MSQHTPISEHMSGDGALTDDEQAQLPPVKSEGGPSPVSADGKDLAGALAGKDAKPKKKPSASVKKKKLPVRELTGASPAFVL